MKTSYSHLPEYAKNDLKQIVNLVLEKVPSLRNDYPVRELAGVHLWNMMNGMNLVYLLHL